MEVFARYLLISTCCLAVFYLAFKLLIVKRQPPNHQRYFLLIVTVLSLLIPFSKFQIDVNIKQTITEKVGVAVLDNSSNDIKLGTVTQLENISKNKNTFQLKSFLIVMYLLGLILLLVRFFLHVFKITYRYMHAQKTVLWGIQVLCHDKNQMPFSFFKWIFIPDNFIRNRENRDILIHENIHATQYHSIDIILIELLSAFMWFNPLIWMMKYSLRLVHEYLADEGVLNTGVDKIRYQALLINHIAEDRLIGLTSNFNHSLIKKRIIMMSIKKLNQGSIFRMLTLLPVAVLLFIGVACIDGNEKSEKKSSFETVKKEILLIGIDNPIKIVVPEFKSSNLTVEVDNGSISGNNENFIIVPKTEGVLTLSINNKGDLVQKREFQVSKIPSPIAKVMGKSGGPISEGLLHNAVGIVADFEDFKYDIKSKIVNFNLVITDGVNTKEFELKSNRFNIAQKEAIQNTTKGDQLIINNIKARLPDGTIRDLSPIVFVIE